MSPNPPSSRIRPRAGRRALERRAATIAAHGTLSQLVEQVAFSSRWQARFLHDPIIRIYSSGLALVLELND